MLEFLKKLAQNPGVRKAALALLLALAAAAGFGAAGCGLVGLAPKSPALEAFECRAAVLAPFVAEAAPAVVAQISGGSVNPVELLLSLGLTPAEIVAVAKAHQTCEPVVPETPVDVEPASVIKA